MKIFTTNTFRIFLFLVIFVFFGFGEQAAYADMEFDVTAQWLDNDLSRRRMELARLREKMKKNEGIEKKINNKGGKKLTNTGNFNFKYNPEISTLVRNNEIERVIQLGRRLGTIDKEKENILHESISQIDIMKTVGEGLKKKGHSPHSLPTAMAYWVASHLQIVHDTPFTDKQLAAIVGQFEKQMKENTKKMPNDEEKQMAAEHLMWSATLQLLSYNNVRDNGGSEGDLRDVADVSRAMMKEEFNLDADKIMIGDKGLMPK